MNKLKLMEILARIPLFKGLVPAERETLLKLASAFRPIKNKDVFIKEGSHEPFFYIILAGSAEVSHKNKIIGELHSGQFIGEVGFICKEPRSATVTATSDMVVMRLSTEEFRKIPIRIRENIKDKIIAGLVERVTGMNENVIKYEDEIDDLKVKIRDYEEDPRLDRRAKVVKAHPESKPESQKENENKENHE